MATQLGVIGLGTMGANLARNAARNGAKVSVFNRTPQRVDEFLRDHGAEGAFVGCKTLRELCASLKPPRAVLLMVKAGGAVDDVIGELAEHLSEGDIIVDAGNSHFEETARREKKAADKGLRFLGMGVSGGEEGALNGPSMMPGGDESAYRVLEPLFEKMAAEDGEGGRCIAFMGPGGSGHFVKMAHNGIEYGLMQLIAEAYDVLRDDGATAESLAETFGAWAKTEALQSFLMDITAQALRKKDDETGEPLVDLIKDAAAQKGTGKWTVNAALELGMAVPIMTAAVEARILSSEPDERARWSKEWPEALTEPLSDYKPLKELAKSALELSSITAYLQGFELIRQAGIAHKWQLPLGEIARIWRGGCIIRSSLLPWFQEMFATDETRRQAARARMIDRFQGDAQTEWRRFIAHATGRGIPVPAFSAALAYYDTQRRTRLPQNLVQALRDLFGAHGYERRDREGTFHTAWNGE